MKKTCLLAATILLPLSAQEISAGYSDFEFASVKGVSTDRTGAREEVAAMIYWKLEVHAHRARLSIGSQAAKHAYKHTTDRLHQAQSLPIEALSTIQTLAEARQAEIDAILDYNIAQHRILAALGTPR